jgi:hypothetical protein
MTDDQATIEIEMSVMMLGAVYASSLIGMICWMI